MFCDVLRAELGNLVCHLWLHGQLMSTLLLRLPSRKTSIQSGTFFGKPEDHWRSRNQKPHKLDPKKISNLPDLSGFTGESFQEFQWLHPGPKVAAVAVTNDHWHHRPHTALKMEDPKILSLIIIVLTKSRV